MKLYFSSHEECSRQGVLVLGTFDGVHIGHQQLLLKGKKLAKELDAPLVFSTFYPHPLQIINPSAAPKEITTVLERACVLSLTGVDAMLIWKFAAEIRNLSADDFISNIVLPLRPKAVVIGFNYTFGKNGAGTPRLMRLYGKKYGFTVEEVPPVTVDGEVVSSTRIRNFLLEGNMREAKKLLSRPYSIQGEVVHGKKEGGKLGFATANILPHKDKILPPFGVYIAYVKTKNGLYPAIVNIGRQPTLPSGYITVEAHILMENLNLYQEKIRIFFLEYVRPEKAFDSVSALQEQVNNDIKQAQQYFKQNPIDLEINIEE